MKISEYVKKIYEKLDDGDTLGALKLVRNIEEGEYDILEKEYYLSNVYVDIGSILNKEDLIKKGIDCIEKNFDQLTKNTNINQIVYYNLGNGYISLYNLKVKSNKYYGFMNPKTENHEGIEYYKKAIKCQNMYEELQVKIFVNMANSLDSLGRNMEAIEYYDKALAINPKHGMALANKGIAIKYYAKLTRHKSKKYYKIAHELIKQGIKNGVHKEAESIFLDNMNEIENILEDFLYIGEESDKNISLNFKNDFEKKSTDFYYKNKLYLNLCNHCQNCNSSLEDNISINEKIIDFSNGIDKERFLELSQFLREIKQNYITSRLLLAQGVIKDNSINFVDNEISIIDAEENIMNNTYIQLIKFAFKNMFDILDKISIFINRYMNLGKNEKYIDFKKIWYKGDFKKGNIDENISNSKNFNMNALFNIHLELSNGEYMELNNIRNALTHRFLNIYTDGNNSIDYMSEEYLIEKSIEITKLVRNSIIYLLSFVESEESHKIL